MVGVLLPGRCAGCGAAAWPLCAACARAAPVVTAPICGRCGRPTEEPVDRCGDCPPGEIDLARAPFLYAGSIARAVRAMKFSGWHGLAPLLAEAMAESLDATEAATLVTWVPLSPRRLATRGFDQARLLARSLAARLEIPDAALLKRVRDTPPQARRGAEERHRALAGAFLSRPSPPYVLLVDDVLTTGATGAACAEALKRSGARRVVLATAARSLSTNIPARCR